MKCQIHPTEELIEREGKYGKFWSHKHDGAWCNGKPPKTDGNQIAEVILNKVIGLEKRFDKMAAFLSGSVETRPATKEELKDLPF